MKLFKKSDKPLKYSSADTRYASLHGFQNGAEFNEVNEAPTRLGFEVPDNLWASNIRSGQNVTDIPSRFGDQKGSRKIGPRTFTAQDETRSWLRKRGEW